LQAATAALYSAFRAKNNSLNLPHKIAPQIADDLNQLATDFANWLHAGDVNSAITAFRDDPTIDADDKWKAFDAIGDQLKRVFEWVDKIPRATLEPAVLIEPVNEVLERTAP